MIVGLLLASSLSVATVQADPTDLRLAPCSVDATLRCLHLTTSLPPRASAGADLTDRDLWTVGFHDLGLPVSAVRPGSEGEAEFSLLVLVDLSGSMRGQGIQIVRSALRSFLSELPPHVRVAVAPFSSRRVAPVIQNVTFRSGAEAAFDLGMLPTPAGNTGLYSAVALGIERVQSELRSDRGAAGGVLVFTDGRNDVGNAGDDPGLLSGDAGRIEVRNRVVGAQVPTWILGVGGGVDANELEAIVADPRLVSLVPSLDPVAISGPLAGVRSSFFRSWSVEALAPDWAELRLNRGPLSIDVSATLADGAEPTRWALDWSPPLFVGDRGPHSSDVASVAPRPATSVWAVSGFLALLFWALGHLAYATATANQKPTLRALRSRRRSKGEGHSDPEDFLRSAVETAPRTTNQPTASRAVRQNPIT